MDKQNGLPERLIGEFSNATNRRIRSLEMIRQPFTTCIARPASQMILLNLSHGHEFGKSGVQVMRGHGVFMSAKSAADHYDIRTCQTPNFRIPSKSRKAMNQIWHQVNIKRTYVRARCSVGFLRRLQNFEKQLTAVVVTELSEETSG